MKIIELTIIMSVIDIIILICFLPAIYYGIKDGFIRQLAGIVALILGAWLAWKFSYLLCTIIDKWIDAGETIIKIISFSAIFIVVIILVNLVGKLIEKIIKITMLSWANRLLGIIFSLLKAAIIISVIILVIDAANNLFEIIPKETIADSKLYDPFSKLISILFPYLKEFFN